MKTLAALLTVLGFVTSAHAIVEDDAQRYTLVACENEQLQVRVYNTENLKDAQLVVANVSPENPGIMFNDVVRPQDTDNRDIQIYTSGNASLRVVPNAEGLKGFLNLSNDQPGVGQVLNCEMYYHILEPAQLM